MSKPKKAESERLYTVIRDTREQQGWVFEESFSCSGTILKGLKTGDYTLEGYENILCIERKKTVAEFAKNITEARFEREMVRLEAFPKAYIVCEFSMDDIMRWPLNSGLPKYLIPSVKINKYFIIKRLVEFISQYKTQFILAGPYGKEVVSSIFKEIVKSHARQTP